MEWAALVLWVLTALGGSVLLLVWLRHGGLRQHEGIRAVRIFLHVALAVVGLILWIYYVAGGTGAAAWIAVALLALVAAVGGSMLLLHLGGRTKETRTEPPAEGMFPVPIVLGHGALALATVVLAILAAAGVGV